MVAAISRMPPRRKLFFWKKPLAIPGMEPMLTPQDVDQLYWLDWQGAKEEPTKSPRLYGQDLNTPKGRTEFVGEFVAKASAWWLEQPSCGGG